MGTATSEKCLVYNTVSRVTLLAPYRPTGKLLPNENVSLRELLVFIDTSKKVLVCNTAPGLALLSQYRLKVKIGYGLIQNGHLGLSRL